MRLHLYRGAYVHAHSQDRRVACPLLLLLRLLLLLSLSWSTAGTPRAQAAVQPPSSLPSPHHTTPSMSERTGSLSGSSGTGRVIGRRGSESGCLRQILTH